MKGKVLISSPSLLTDLIFYKSIILIVEKTNEDITGFIINRPLDKILMREVETKKKFKINLYYGGPVSSEHFFILKSKRKYSELINVYDNIYWGNDIEFLFIMLEKGAIGIDDFILLQGYSGWNFNQLNNEIYNKNWTIIEKKADNLFSLREKNSWNILVKSLGNKYRLWSNSPDDITLN